MELQGAVMSAPDEIRQELLAAMREIIKRAVITLNAVPDIDARFRGWAKSPARIVRDQQEAYGWALVSVKHQPSPQEIKQADLVHPWLAWIRRVEGQRDLDRITAWSLGVPAWKLGDLERCSDRTVINRIDRSVAAVIKQFVNVDIPIEFVDEPHENALYAMVWEYPPGPITGEVISMKIFIGDRGFWKAGRYLRDGHEKIDRIRRVR
jgi:hypothetical protein